MNGINLTDINGLTERDYKNIGLAQLIPATISLVCILFTLILALVLKQYRDTTNKLVLYLFLGQLLNSIAYLLKGVFYNKVDDGVFCKAIAYYNQFTSSCILAAICCIIIELFVKTVVVGRRCRCQLFYLLLIFPLPLAVSALPFIHGAYGNAGPWCWIEAISYDENGTARVEPIGLAYQYGLWYGPLYTLLIAGGFVYTYSIFRLYRELKKSKNTYTSHHQKLKRQKMLQKLKSVKWYPIIYCVVNILTLGTRIDEQVSPKHYHTTLWIVSAAILSLQGVFFMIGFLVSPTVRRKLSPKVIKITLQDKLSSRTTPTQAESVGEDTPLSGRSIASSPDIEEEEEVERSERITGERRTTYVTART